MMSQCVGEYIIALIVDKNFHFHAVFTAGGTWQAAAIYPPGEPEDPLELRTPDQPMPSCACQPLKLDYNPNNEDQADFHCITELMWQVSIMLST